jgi:PAS domain-containing protein
LSVFHVREERGIVANYHNFDQIGLAIWSPRVSTGETQDEARSEKYLLDTALQNMPHGLCMDEKDGRIILFNDRYARLMGITPTDLKGLSLLDTFKLRKEAGALERRP